MPIKDIYSKRQKKKRGEIPDVFQYDFLPEAFRVQVVHILRDALGTPSHSAMTGYSDDINAAYKVIHDSLCREYGIFRLIENPDGNFARSVLNFLLTADTEEALDVIETSFQKVIQNANNHQYRRNQGVSINAKDSVDELNSRFLEHGIGYQFESGEIIRIDSKLAHTEIIKPALQSLLSNKIYEGANEEFLKAHEHYRHGRNKECLSDCLKSFESVIKAICKKQKWQYNELDTAKKLLDICFQNNLIPEYLQQHFSSLRSGLESGIPTVRNRLAGHGQGTEPIIVPPYFAQYLLNLTATSILMLVESEKNLPEKK